MESWKSFSQNGQIPMSRQVVCSSATMTPPPPHRPRPRGPAPSSSGGFEVRLRVHLKENPRLTSEDGDGRPRRYHGRRRTRQGGGSDGGVRRTSEWEVLPTQTHSRPLLTHQWVEKFAFHARTSSFLQGHMTKEGGAGTEGCWGGGIPSGSSAVRLRDLT